MKLNEQSARAITELRKTADFKVYMMALGDYAEAVMRKLVMSPQDNLHTAQGKAQCVTEILKAIDNAPAELEAFKARGRSNTQI